MKNTTTTIFAFIYVIENSMNFQNKKKIIFKNIWHAYWIDLILKTQTNNIWPCGMENEFLNDPLMTMGLANKLLKKIKKKMNKTISNHHWPSSSPNHNIPMSIDHNSNCFHH